MENQIENLKSQLKAISTATEKGRQFVADSCKELYDIIEEGLYNKYGQEAIDDAYNDLCCGNFSEPFYCEKKKERFFLYANIYISKIDKTKVS